MSAQGSGPRTINRRRFLTLTGVGAVGIAGGGTAAAQAIGRTQRAEQAQAAAAATPTPTALPQFTVLVDEPGTAAGDIFFTNMSEAAAPVITDPAGQIVWTQTDTGAKSCADLRLQTYQGRPVINWWESHSTGLAQLLDNGNVFVGWGTAQRISEFTPDGTLLFDATLPQVSYRAYRHLWR